MKINFTKKEYSLLLDMLYLSDWMMHSYEIEDKKNDYKMLRKKILSFFEEMGAENLIEYAKDSDDYYELAPYDMELHEKFIEPYDDEMFWEELIERLGRRDVINQVGLDAFAKMDPQDRAKMISEATNLYANEFSNHGLYNLKITRDKSTVN